MKLIFLDIFGVLTNQENNEKLHRKGKYPFCAIDLKSLNLLKELINVTGAKIILTSKLRKDFSKEAKNVKNKLKSEGIEIYDNIFEDLPSRKDEINKFIYCMSQSGNNIESYVVLDDENIMPDDEHLVLCRSGLDNKDGFTYKHFMKAIKILMGEDYIYVEGGKI